MTGYDDGCAGQTSLLWSCSRYTAMFSHCLTLSIVTCRAITIIIGMALTLSLITITMLPAVYALESPNRAPVVGNFNGDHRIPDLWESIADGEGRNGTAPSGSSSNENPNDSNTSSSVTYEPPGGVKENKYFSSVIRCAGSIFLDPFCVLLTSHFQTDILHVVCPDQPLDVINATKGNLTVELWLMERSPVHQEIFRLVASGRGWADSAPTLVGDFSRRLGGSVRLTREGGGLVYNLQQVGCPLDDALFLCHYVLEADASPSPLYSCCTASSLRVVNEDVEKSRIVGNESDSRVTTYWSRVTMECRKTGMPVDRQWVWQFSAGGGRGRGGGSDWKAIKVENPEVDLEACNFQETTSTLTLKLEPDGFLCTGRVRCVLARYVSMERDRDSIVTDVLMEHTFQKRKCKPRGSASQHPHLNNRASEHQPGWPGRLLVQVASCLAIVALTR